MKAIITFFIIFLIGIKPNLSSAQSCKDIRTTKDSRTGNVKHESPLFLDITFVKEVIKTDTFYYLSLQVISPNVRSNHKGCKVKLSDSSILDFPEQYVQVDQMLSYGGRNVHKYYAKIPLSKNDIEKLSIHDIIDFWVYIQQSSVSKLLTEKKSKKTLRAYFNCILKV